MDAQEFLTKCNFEKSDGLLPVVAQDVDTKDVLMVAFISREALEKTLETGQMFYQSRQRGLWHKGETSGNFQNVLSLRLDCDNDTILALVKPDGPSCHNGTLTCFMDTPAFIAERK